MSKNKRGKGAAADFGYAMPTTVGILNHDPTRPRAPGFSFGTRPNEKDRPRAPGPQYKVDQGLTPRGTGYNPSFSITKRPRRTVWDSMMSQGPSPGAYNPQTSSSGASWEKAAPMYSFGKTFKARKRTPVPAPNTYSIPGTIGSQAPELSGNGPASTLRGKISGSKDFSYDFAKTPGPAKYDAVPLSNTKKRAPAPTMKGRFKLPSWETPTPGPAAYQTTSLEKYSKDSPRMTLRAHYKSDMRLPLFAMTDVSI